MNQSYSGSNYQINLQVNDEKIKKATKEAIEQALQKIGMAAVRFATAKCPVDTGRLRNSITYITKNKSGGSSYSDNKGNSFNNSLSVSADEGEVWVGTNVEYARYVEYGTRGRSGKPFLRSAIKDHTDFYNKLVQDTLKRLQSP